MLRRGSPPEVDWDPEPEDDFDDDPRPYRIGGRKTTIVLFLFALLFLAIAVLRVVGADGNPITIVALSYSPYVAVGGAVLFVIAFGLRRRILALAVLLMALSMVVLLLPRFFSNDQPAADGPHIRIMSAPATAEPATLVRLVRDNHVDVLTTPALAAPTLAALDTAGLILELPNRIADPGAPAILSRYPLRRIVVIDSNPPQPSAVVDLPTLDDLEVLPIAIPSPLSSATPWQTQLARLPFTNPARPRVLAGDFAASFDHGTFRAVLDRGYVDAAEQSGDGLIPTWSGWGLPITTDHVLVDQRCAILGYQVLNLPDSSHDAIFAEIALP